MDFFNKILQHNWVAIIYFNFKMLPFKEAIKFPFDFYHSVRFESLKGKIIIKSDKIYRGMIKIGARGSDIFPDRCTIIHLDGDLQIKDKVEFGIGSTIFIGRNAKCILENKVRIGARTKLYCENFVYIGNEVDISWESQIFDTNFHYMENIIDKVIKPKSSPIKIGSYNWIGNRVTIMKGTVLGNNMIVASNSLLNKNYLSTPEYSVLGGSPAKVVKENIRRLFPDEEKIYIKNLQ